MPCQQPSHLGPSSTLLAPPPLLHALPSPSPHVAPLLMLLLSTRQDASSFNQPLSFDTSSVKDMGYMFNVRFARALPAASTDGSSLRTACAAAATPRPPVSWPARRPSSYASLLTRQYASSFNQPLSLDTSSVTDMTYMFMVRSGRALPAASAAGPSLHAACVAAASPCPPDHPARTSPLLLCFPLHSAGRKQFVRREQAPHPLCMVGQYRV